MVKLLYSVLNIRSPATGTTIPKIDGCEPELEAESDHWAKLEHGVEQEPVAGPEPGAEPKLST